MPTDDPVPTADDGRALSADQGLEPTIGPDVVRDLERTLGIGVIVLSIEEEPTVTIRALLMLGPHTAEVTGVGSTEAAAWHDLARAAIAWRTSDDKHIPLWPGGGNV